MVQTKQMRFLSLESNPRIRPAVKPNGKRKVELYTRFWNKYEKIRDIDFGAFMQNPWQVPCGRDIRIDSVLHVVQVAHVRWSLIFTSTVIDDMIKKGKSAERPPEIGFSKRFAPKFMPPEKGIPSRNKRKSSNALDSNVGVAFKAATFWNKLSGYVPLF
ncbi:hypothetical protein MHU86_4598 [Fragilaria crotonensis]|nr:hypothetical protein MHU86_4598 [Fragilaria crotonensis]